MQIGDRPGRRYLVNHSVVRRAPDRTVQGHTIKISIAALCHRSSWKDRVSGNSTEVVERIDGLRPRRNSHPGEQSEKREHHKRNGSAAEGSSGSANAIHIASPRESRSHPDWGHGDCRSDSLLWSMLRQQRARYIEITSHLFCLHHVTASSLSSRLARSCQSARVSAMVDCLRDVNTYECVQQAPGRGA